MSNQKWSRAVWAMPSHYHGAVGARCHAWHAGLGLTRCAWYWYMAATLVYAALSVPKPYCEALYAYACGTNSYGRIAPAPDFCAAEKASLRNCASVALSCPGACARSLGLGVRPMVASAAENACSKNCAGVVLSCPGACACSLGFRDQA